jgi:hypothetical protein
VVPVLTLGTLFGRMLNQPVCMPGTSTTNKTADSRFVACMLDFICDRRAIIPMQLYRKPFLLLVSFILTPVDDGAATIYRDSLLHSFLLHRSSLAWAAFLVEWCNGEFNIRLVVVFRIVFFPPVRSYQQGQALRGLNLQQPYGDSRGW